MFSQDGGLEGGSGRGRGGGVAGEVYEGDIMWSVKSKHSIQSALPELLPAASIRIPRVYGARPLPNAPI